MASDADQQPVAESDRCIDKVTGPASLGSASLAALLAEVSTRFLNMPVEGTDEGITAMLASVGELTGVDRAYLFRFDRRARTFSNTHEWCAPGVKPEISNLQGLHFDEHDWWMSRFERKESVHIQRVADLPPEADTAREILQAQDIQSVLCVPICWQGETVGFLGFDAVRAERAWAPGDQRILEALANIVALVLDRRRREETLRTTAEGLAKAQQVARLGSWELDLATGEGRWSDEMFRLTGLDPETWHLNRDDFLKWIHPEDRARLRHADAVATHTGGPTDLIVRSSPWRGPVREFHVLLEGVRGSSGEPIKLVGTLQDVTERRRAARTIEEQRDLLDALLDNLPVGVRLSDAQGKVLRYNRAAKEIIGWSAEEVPTLDAWFERVYPDPAYRREVLEIWRHDAKRAAGGAREFRVTARDGTEREVEFRARHMADGRAVACMLDVTERKQAQAAQHSLTRQLRVAQRMEAIGRLAGGVAHDFNNLLAVILSYTDFAIEGLSPGDPLIEDLAQVRNTVDRAADLVRQLLAFSSRQILQPEVLDLNGVLDALQRMLRRVIGENVALKLELEPGLRPVLADRGQIEQVLLNLAINARDAMPEGGALTLRTASVAAATSTAMEPPGTQEGPRALVAVTDTGCGMDEETLSKVFEPFFTTKGPGAGTGLGLSTVYGIVQQSGGTILVDSELGQGTTFSLYLPVAQRAHRPAPTPDPACSLSLGTGTVLMAEDELPVRKAVRRILTLAGYDVLSAEDGEQALAVAAEHQGPIHLLLTDLVMPNMGGGELAARLREERPGLPVLAMSGYALGGLGPPGSAAEHLPCIAKPFSAADLTARIHELLSADPE